MGHRHEQSSRYSRLLESEAVSMSLVHARTVKFHGRFRFVEPNHFS